MRRNSALGGNAGGTMRVMSHVGWHSTGRMVAAASRAPLPVGWMPPVPQSPSFRGRSPSSHMSSGTKKRNRSRDTKAELALRKCLWRLGLRYRIDDRALPGRPDVVFSGPRVAVFCDGDFWHGRHWPTLRRQLEERANSEYWVAKIHGNRERDKRVTDELESAGWEVIRLWETDILDDPRGAAQSVHEVVTARRESRDGSGG
ncbi:MAG: DNA mismatch endonuclease Vsr [Armatimonadia bacterium]|nr:DNA mismatch endonuclease Vsr [Armatimonadia bacterium]